MCSALNHLSGVVWISDDYIAAAGEAHRDTEAGEGSVAAGIEDMGSG